MMKRSKGSKSQKLSHFLEPIQQNPIHEEDLSSEKRRLSSGKTISAKNISNNPHQVKEKSVQEEIKVQISNEYSTDLDIIREEFLNSKEKILKELREKNGYSEERVEQLEGFIDEKMQKAYNHVINNLKFFTKPRYVIEKREKIPIKAKLDQNYFKTTEIALNILKSGVVRNKEEQMKVNPIRIQPDTSQQLLIQRQNGDLIQVTELLSKVPMELLKRQQDVVKKLELLAKENLRRFQELRSVNDQRNSKIYAKTSRFQSIKWNRQTS